MENQTKNLRLQETLGKQFFMIFMKKSFEPVTDTVEEVSKEVRKITEAVRSIGRMRVKPITRSANTGLLRL